MEFHPVANVFPLMEGDEFEELVKDVAEHGQQQPILTYEGKILDGRNRYRACLEAGAEPWVESWSGTSPVEAVLSLNLHRRHLSSSQRAAVATRMLPHLEAEAKKRQGARTDLTSGKEFPQVEKRPPERATAEAAKLTGTNPRYVSDAKRLQREVPSEFARVERGETTIPKAVKGTREPTVRDAVEDAASKGERLEVPPFDLPPERKAYRAVVMGFKDTKRLDLNAVLDQCKGSEDAARQAEALEGIASWASEWAAAFREQSNQRNLRAVN